MKAALITGASYGIGLEFARIFAKNGSDLVLVSRSENKLKELAEEIETAYKVKVRVIVKDLAGLLRHPFAFFTVSVPVYVPAA